MSIKINKKIRKEFREKINGAATLALRREIFRLARNRDILGVVAIAEAIVIIILGIMLCK
ncbi:MAG: hypothetical protein Pg6C_06060 [Treponemataceae bacterium]|jgi:hypothetical protein|nr:MAG: hypothetical protein Pg6C_06060 [Treponemataceae bacterium]